MGSRPGIARRKAQVDTIRGLEVATGVERGFAGMHVVVDGKSGRVCSDDRICLPARLLGATTANAKRRLLHSQISPLPRPGRLTDNHVLSSTNRGRCACVMPTIKALSAATWSLSLPTSF